MLAPMSRCATDILRPGLCIRQHMDRASTCVLFAVPENFLDLVKKRIQTTQSVLLLMFVFLMGNPAHIVQRACVPVVCVQLTLWSKF